MTDMDRQMDRLPDTEINAYVDGELDQQGLAEVEAWLADHPDDAARVHAYKLQRLHLHQLYDLPKNAPLPDSVREVLAANSMRRWLPGWRQLAAGIMLLVVGGVGGWYGDNFVARSQGSPGTAFVQRAMNAYAVFAYDASRPVEIGVSDGDYLGWLSERVGQTLRTPDLSAAGFALIGGRLVNDQGEPAALFMYEDQKNQRVTLYVRHASGALDDKIRSVIDHRKAAVYWSDRSRDFAIAGELPQSELKRLAQMITQDMEAKAST
jgi:anti-sigma factor RsiW